MKLTINRNNPHTADGNYHVRARGCIAATLSWADEAGALPGWQSFACFPIEPNGMGMYRYTGARAIPEDATHVLARAVSADFQEVEEALEPIPHREREILQHPNHRFLVMTDLHLSSKPWQVRRALAMGNGYDAVLITGDMTNDGTQEQLELFWNCVNAVLPDTPVLAVTGNHDYPARPLPGIPTGIWDYAALQQQLLHRAKEMGLDCRQDISGLYTVTFGDLQLIALNAASHWRRFRFPKDGQLERLEACLRESCHMPQVILCHAPPADHRPYKGAQEPPYLSRNAELQRLLDQTHGEMIFLSGHSHLSLNNREGCVEMAQGNHLYINAGSIRPTTLKDDEPLQPESWTEGNVVELLISDRQTTVTGISVKTGKRIARGHYVFRK